MDELLKDTLVCPRDRGELRERGGKLRCDQGHSYPIYDGIPVMLLGDVEQTAWWAATSIERAKSGAESADISPALHDEVDAHVQSMVAATSGYLYKPLVNKLKTYPIPE